MSKIQVIDRPEYSRVEMDTFDPVILGTDVQQIIPAGTVLGKVTASGKYTPLTILAQDAESDGSDVPAAILLDQVIVLADEDLKKGAVCVFRHARVLRDQLVWPDDYTDEQIATALATLEAIGIIASTK